MAIKNQTGPPVTDNDFFGREQELAYAWDHIQKGNSFILSAPRRVGKSSFAKRMLQIAKENGWNTLEIDLQEVRSEEGFVKIFIDKLENQDWWTRTKSKVGKKFEQIVAALKPSVSFGETNVGLEFELVKEDVYEQLKNILTHEKETLIMVDEVTIFLNNLLGRDKENGKVNVTFFLNWLRSIRQVTNTKVKWIFCSSIGIENFTNMHSLSYTMNDIDSLPIDAFTPEQAAELLRQLALTDSLPFKEEHIQYILDKLVWHLPFFIQLIYNSIIKKIKIESMQLSILTIDEAYRVLIEEKHLNTWDERLEDYKDLEKYARMILKRLAQNKNGENRSALYQLLNTKIMDDEKAETMNTQVLYMLRNDGYLLITQNGSYIFRSPLLRDFWFNRFIK